MSHADGSAGSARYSSRSVIGSGLPQKYPCATVQPHEARALAVSTFSTPSATAVRPRVSVRSITVRTIAAARRSSVIDAMKDRSSLTSSMGSSRK